MFVLEARMSTSATNPLDAFLPPTRIWFEQTLGQPTPPQAAGWPAIQRGENTLIMAPTGSGKTLTAFLWGIDQIFRILPAPMPQVEEKSKRRRRRTAAPPPQGIHLIYISPLKALNNDIERNLRAPLLGIRHTAEAMGQELPEIQVAVRSGDTPSRERQAMLRKAPHILITTPESLYILLTSPRARELFRTVRTLIVDEIHTLAGSKRGVHLALSMERLQHIAEQPIQRIGLSATIRPLQEVARYLGGSEWHGPGEATTLAPRPVTIVDAVYRKQLDLLVETVVEDFRNMAGGSVWPSVVARVNELIEQHRSTLIFVNNRRLAERAADWLNEVRAAGGSSAFNPAAGLLEGGVAKGLGMFGAGTGQHADPIRAHHGSMSKEIRLALENDLKAGRLPAIIGTSSLELGIDIGAVDLVVQLQAPKAVAQGLQRIGRAGHLVGQTSKGRFFPTHREDVMEAAAVAGGMLRGEVELTHTPRNPLDVLAQQIVSIVSVENWHVDDLYRLIRQAYPYVDLGLRAYTSVLDMLGGRYPSLAHGELRPRLVWDKVNQQLAALPGSRLMAMTSGGTIPDRGAFGAYLSDGKTKLGELDEEFVYETRVGDTFTLGSQVWRVLEVTDDKVIVGDAAGSVPRMPFWRGDYPWRPYELGEKVGAFRRAVAERLQAAAAVLGLEELRVAAAQRDTPPLQELLAWLRRDYALDDNSAWIVVDYVAGQVDHAGAISSDRSVLVEVFDDAVGDPRLVIQSPFGGRVNGLWGIALASALRERTGVEVEVQSNDDGILFRFPAAEADFPLDLVAGMTPAEARERILGELPNSAVFGAQFRQNAARALLLPGLGRGKRTPFWLQRLRAKDLLQVVRRFEDFPIVAETYRDCLQEVMDLPHLEVVLGAIQRGEIEIVAIESLTPSPVAQSLLWDFISIYMYEWDAPKAERQLQTLAANRDLLQELLQDIDLSDLLRPEAVAEVRGRLQHTAPAVQVRTFEELAYLFQSVGDLSSVEVAERCTVDPASWLGRLAGNGRVVSLPIPTDRRIEPRWVAAELAPEYVAAFDLSQVPVAKGYAAWDFSVDEARRRILHRYLAQAGPTTAESIRLRYAFPPDWLAGELADLVASRQMAQGRFTPGTPAGEETAEFVDRRVLEQMHRRTLTILRNEVQPVSCAGYADFLARWQHIHPAHRLAGDGGLRRVLQQLRAAPVVGRTWERDVLPLRLEGYQPRALADLCQSGELVWVGSGGTDPRRLRIRYLFRGEGSAYLEPASEDISGLSKHAQAVHAFLKSEGAAFPADLRAALDLGEQDAAAALWELAAAGLATSDNLGSLRELLQYGVPAASHEPRPLSPLEAELAERLAQQRAQRGSAAGIPGLRPTFGGSVARPGRSELATARRRIAERLRQPQESLRTPKQEGRWALVHRFGIMGKPLPPAEIAARQARQLLARHGVVTHESLDDEIGAWEWGIIYPELQRLEMRGEVRRGYFVRGLPGVQFALPEVVELLRAGATKTIDQDEPVILLNACDPANLYGPAGELLLTSGEPLAFARIPSTWLAQQRGQPVLLIGDSGTDLKTTQEADAAQVRRALQAWVTHAGGFELRLSVSTWNGQPVLGSAGQSLLEAAGFYRDYTAMTWERRRQ
jgi:ATP-dependent Lhr-like helicase